MTERKKPTTDALAAVVPLKAGELADTEPAARSSWLPVDLEEALAGGDVPPPAILHRTDGVPLLYPAKTHAFIGESESGKTWAALVAVVEVLAAGGSVLWVDFEDNAHTAVGRLRALGAEVEAVRSRFHYLQPSEQLVNRSGAFTTGAAALAELLQTTPYALAVVDGVTEGMAVEGLDPLGTVDFATWNERLLRRIANAGPAVVFVDHVPKNTENRGRYALGSQHKISGLSGAGYVFEVVTALRRATGGEPVTGTVHVSVVKDRPGWVRARSVSVDQVARVATLQMTAYPDGGITAALVPPDHAVTAPPTDLQARVLAHVKLYDGCTVTAVTEAITGKATAIRAALAWLAKAGYLEVNTAGRGGAHRHTITDAGRDHLAELDAGQ
jgi:hypothetical protein